MYIVEFLIKKIMQRKSKPKDPFEEEVRYEKCEHLFMPIDSSKKRFACPKCGQYAEFETLADS